MKQSVSVSASTPKVFGIGHSRTGTKSLCYALHQLGVNIAHFPDDARTFQELSSGGGRFSLLETMDGIADITVSYLYPQLDQQYPGSKFILTVRDKQDWLRSVEQHWAANPCFDDHQRQGPSDRVHMAVRQLLCATVYGSYEFDCDRASYVYDLHHKNVTDYFKGRENDLLILNICAGESWQKLCHFLEKPALHRPFPRLKERNELVSVLNADADKDVRTESKTQLVSLI